MKQQWYSAMTIRNYMNQLVQLFKYFAGKPINQIEVSDIEKYNYEVVLKNGFSVSYQRGMVGAVKLFYHRLSDKVMDLNKLQHPFREQRLPEVLSKQEVRKILLATENIKQKPCYLLFMVAGSGAQNY